MDFVKIFKNNLWFVDQNNFDDKCLEVFAWQWKNNKLYKHYCEAHKKSPRNVTSIDDIPFLPISFFKKTKIQSGNWPLTEFFLSSGTTGRTKSRHYINDLAFYKQNCERIFEGIYGSLKQWTIFALLPNYYGNKYSSLIAMINHFIHLASPQSRFILDDMGQLKYLLENTERAMVFGVSYALLELAKVVESTDWSRHIFLETGGMKGRGREMVRSELHGIFKKAFGSAMVHSEYGMTELLSQAYSTDEGYFRFPKWVCPKVYEITDPLTLSKKGSYGLMNIIDLANIDTCAFIETQDIGKMVDKGSFQILGRLDNSDVRGCNLMLP